MINPEQMSLSAHKHITNYLNGNTILADDDLTAILRLSQHLRVFGLLSAIGYLNQDNNQNGQVRQRTIRVWESLLGQLMDEDNPPDCQTLMQGIIDLAKDQPNQYMTAWRRSLILANHWNFWARAYKE